MCHLIVSINLKYRANVFIEKQNSAMLELNVFLSFLHIILYQLTHKSFSGTSVSHHTFFVFKGKVHFV